MVLFPFKTIESKRLIKFTFSCFLFLSAPIIHSRPPHSNGLHDKIAFFISSRKFLPRSIFHNTWNTSCIIIFSHVMVIFLGPYLCWWWRKESHRGEWQLFLFAEQWPRTSNRKGLGSEGTKCSKTDLSIALPKILMFLATKMNSVNIIISFISARSTSWFRILVQCRTDSLVQALSKLILI